MTSKRLGERETKELKELIREREDAERAVANCDAMISEKIEEIAMLREQIKEERAVMASYSVRNLAKRFGVSVTAIKTALKP